MLLGLRRRHFYEVALVEDHFRNSTILLRTAASVMPLYGFMALFEMT